MQAESAKQTNYDMYFVSSDKQWKCKFIAKHTSVSSTVVFEDGKVANILNSMLHRIH